MELPIGTGPFKFVKWNKQKEIILEKNSEYWAEKPNIDTIIFNLNSFSSSNARALLNNGELDIIDLERAKDDKNTFYYKAETLLTAFMSLNCSKPPFNNKILRKAVLQAINRQEIFERYFEGSGTFATSIFPPEVSGFSGDIYFSPYNIDSANELVKTAVTKQPINVVLADIYFQNPAMYQEIKISLKKIGFNVLIKENLSETEIGQMLKNNAYDMIFVAWQCDNGDPDNYSSLVDSNDKNQNFSRYANKKMDELIEKGRKVPYGGERNRVFKEIQSLIAEDVPIIPLIHAGRTYGLSPRIKNFRVHPTGAILFKYIDIVK
jgi:peptide/nickel transport system substrate-binding protein